MDDETNAEAAERFAAEATRLGSDDDTKATVAIAYAVLALADEVRNLAAEVEKAGWAKE